MTPSLSNNLNPLTQEQLDDAILTAEQLAAQTISDAIKESTNDTNNSSVTNSTNVSINSTTSISSSDPVDPNPNTPNPLAVDPNSVSEVTKQVASINSRRKMLGNITNRI